MKLKVTPYLKQIADLPPAGRHIIAQYDTESVIVYQAYRPAIGHFAAANGFFGGEFSLNRMSWIKPNFLWMMYRSGWGQKPGQEVILAVKLQRQAFNQILAQAVPSQLTREIYPNKGEWQKALRNSLVRLQWDPAHHPNGEKLPRRAIQLGLRGELLRQYAQQWIIDIEDISEFVQQQYKYVKEQDWDNLLIPQETIYRVKDEITAQKLGIATI